MVSQPVLAQFEKQVQQAPGLSRFDLKYSSGTLAHETLMRSIDLYGREVIPRVRELLAQPEAEAAGDFTPVP